MRKKRIRKRIAPIFEPHYIGDRAAQNHISSLIDEVWIPALRALTTPQGHLTHGVRCPQPTACHTRGTRLA
jgi:hypothetical protein